MRYFIELKFKGTNFHGWQVQPNEITVQEELNTKLSTILRHEITTVGAGRTDTGVHASHFVAHYDYPEDVSDQLDQLIIKLNRFISKDISVQKISLMHDDAHARFDALSRTYEYFISTKKDVFKKDFSWQLYYPLDINKMQDGAEMIKSYSDFTSFSKLHTDTKTNLCSIKRVSWSKTNNQFIFSIQADRFLRNMVRSIVGTLVDIGRDKTKLSDLKNIIESKSRPLAGESAPAQGLFLTHIEYPYPY